MKLSGACDIWSEAAEVQENVRLVDVHFPLVHAWADGFDPRQYPQGAFLASLSLSVADASASTWENSGFVLDPRDGWPDAPDDCLDDQFRGALHSAWRYCHDLPLYLGNDLRPVRLRLRIPYDIPPERLTGESVGGALLLGLYALRTGFELPRRLAVSFVLSHDIGPVGGAAMKAACLPSGWVFMVDHRNADEAENYANPGVRICPCGSIAEAIQIATGRRALERMLRGMDSFLPLRREASLRRPSHGVWINPDGATESAVWSERVDQTSALIVLGGTGMGKSYCLRSTFDAYLGAFLEGGRHKPTELIVPFLLRASEVAKWQPHFFSETLCLYAGTALGPVQGWEEQHGVQLLRMLQQVGSVILLIEEFEYVPPEARQDLLRFLGSLREMGVRFVLASRSAFWRQNEYLPALPQFHLCEWSPSQTTDYVEGLLSAVQSGASSQEHGQREIGLRALRDVLDIGSGGSAPVTQLARRPFYLHLMCEYSQEHSPGELPQKPSDLLQYLLNQHLARYDTVRVGPGREELLDAFKALAYHRMIGGGAHPSQCSPECWRYDVFLLLQIGADLGLLTVGQHSWEDWRFEEPLLQEYLAALFVAGNNQSIVFRDLRRNHVNDPTWYNFFLLVAELTKEMGQEMTMENEALASVLRVALNDLEAAPKAVLAPEIREAVEDALKALHYQIRQSTSLPRLAKVRADLGHFLRATSLGERRLPGFQTWLNVAGQIDERAAQMEQTGAATEAEIIDIEAICVPFRLAFELGRAVAAEDSEQTTGLLERLAQPEHKVNGQNISVFIIQGLVTFVDQETSRARFDDGRLENLADEAVADEAVADEAVADEAVADEAVADEAVADEDEPLPFVPAFKPLTRRLRPLHSSQTLDRPMPQEQWHRPSDYAHDNSIAKTAFELLNRVDERGRIPEDPQIQSQTVGLVWGLLAEGQYGLAYQVAAAAERDLGRAPVSVPLLRLLTLQPYISAAADLNAPLGSAAAPTTVATDLQSLGSTPPTAGAADDPVGLMLFAALLPIIVLDPMAADMAGPFLLDHMRPLLDELRPADPFNEVRKALNQFWEQHEILRDGDAFRVAVDEATINLRLKNLRDRTSKRWDEMLAHSFAYGSADDIWKHWSPPDGALGQVVSVLTAPSEQRKNWNDAEARTIVEAFVVSWKDIRAVDAHFDATDALLRGKSEARKDRIIASPRTQIRLFVEELRKFAQEWQEIRQLEDRSRGYRPLEEIRRPLLKGAQDCLAYLGENLVSRSGTLRLKVAQTVLYRGLSLLMRLLGDGDPLTKPTPLADVLEADLWRWHAGMEPRWSFPEKSDHEPVPADLREQLPSLVSLLTLLTENLSLPGDTDQSEWMRDSFLVKEVHLRWERQMTRGDHRATRLLLFALEHGLGLPGNLSVSPQVSGEDRARKFNQQRQQCNHRLDATRDRLEQHTAYGLFDEEERSAFVGLLDDLHHAENLEYADLCVGFVQDVIRRREENILNELGDRARSLVSDLASIDDTGRARARLKTNLETAIRNKDFLAAFELLDHADTPLDMVDADPEQDTLLRFLESAEHIDNDLKNWWESRFTADLPRAIRGDRWRNPEGIGVLYFGNVVPTERRLAGSMVAAWLALKEATSHLSQEDGQRADDARESAQVHLPTVFHALGFDPPEGQPAIRVRMREHTWEGEMTTRALANVDRVHVPILGWAADGHYAVRLLLNRPTAEEIVQVAEQAGGQQRCPILIFLGRLGIKARRKVAIIARERRQPFLLLDEVLLFFLCQERSRPARLRALVDCTLPFSVTTPYTVTPGLLVPEMFFGREQELRDILDTQGPCLVYGGRQLGKTVLLRMVTRLHDPAHGRLIRFTDLKKHGVGGEYPQRIWKQVQRELKDFGVFPPDVAESPSLWQDSSRIMGHIHRWLDQDRSRRILLMFDESDAFFEADRKQRPMKYPNVEMLKGLMDESGRRFKVVFAGLHSVQRTARDVNSPLHHLQKPITVGPLLGGTGPLDAETASARRLIERPLRNLGYRFAHPNLVTRILGYTNYFPSLMQIFCFELTRYLNQSKAFQTQLKQRGDSPPYSISETDIEHVYSTSDLRKQFIDRLQITLDLDIRYTVIAYIIILKSHATDRDSVRLRQGLVNGFAQTELYQEALRRWGAGFQGRDGGNMSEAEFGALLEEMVGLGVLRQVASTEPRFALRSANMLPMFGTAEQVSLRLEDKTLAVPVADTTVAFRRLYVGDHWPSLFTHAQENTISQGSDRLWVLPLTSLAGGSARAVSSLNSLFEEFGGCKVIDQPLPQEEEADATSVRKWFAQNLPAGGEVKDNGNRVAAIVPEGHWNSASARLLYAHLHTTGGHQRVFLLGSPGNAWEVARATLSGRGVPVLPMEPWDPRMTDIWLETMLTGGNTNEAFWAANARTPGQEDVLAEATGHWGEPLARFVEFCRKSPTDWRAHLNKVRALTDWWDWLDNEDEKKQSVLGFLAQWWDDSDQIEMCCVIGLEDQAARPYVLQVCEWARLLGLGRWASDDGPFQLAPYVRQHLTSFSAEPDQ